MNTFVNPTDFSSYYSKLNNRITQGSPLVVIVFAFVIIAYYLFAAGLPGVSQLPAYTMSEQQSGLNIVEIAMWGIFLFLVLINGLNYFLEIDVVAGVRNIFSGKPEIDIIVSQPSKKEKSVPEIMLEKQVFHVPDNEYTYDDAEAVCKAYGARLATYSEVESAYRAGGEWCGYGWSEGQMALYPTQKKSWEDLQKVEGHEHDCGRPGVNGGYIANPDVRFGVNCYGYKPVATEEETIAMKHIRPYPETQKDKELQKRVDEYRSKLKSIEVAPFNKTRWSLI